MVEKKKIPQEDVAIFYLIDITVFCLLLMKSIYIFVLSLTVTNLNVESVSSASLVLSWEIPPVPCSAEAGYAVEYRLTNKDHCETSENSGYMRKSVFATSVTLSGLQPYSAYEIRVSAAGSVATTTAVTGETG